MSWKKPISITLFEICFHFAGHRSSTQEFSAGPSEFLLDLATLFWCNVSTFWFILDGDWSSYL
jgi:hypothetical protein